MTPHVHDLAGCAPAPLAHYLKALGILRLVSEQVDPTARGWWDGERFRLLTSLDREGLERFFLEAYQPTPLASPWNKGSGYFYAGDPGLSPVEASTANRFKLLREGINAGRSLLGALETADQDVRAIKNETKSNLLTPAEKQALKASDEYKKRLAEAERKFKKLKTELIPIIRLEWRGAHREWMDAAMVLLDDGTPKFPALLGTGGNDGRLDFTNNFFQRLNEIFYLDDQDGKQRLFAKAWLSDALWGGGCLHCQAGSAVGQYLPGMAGGANSGNGPDDNSLLNPFDFILMLEGAMLFSASATRRLGVPHGSSRVAAPFAVGGQGAGYASAADSDESARGEQWMPLWGHPMLLGELKHLLAEGRAQVGARAVKEPLDLARAVARLGVARGINAFQRYGYIERNGQANLAVPLGRFVVPEQTVPQIACLDDLDVWLPRLRLQARDTKTHKASHRLKASEHRLAEAIFAVLQHPNEAARWQAVLLALAGVEAVMVSGSGVKAGPIPKLRPEWVPAGDDGSPEYRLAVSLALQAANFKRDKTPINPVRKHWIAIKNQETAAVMSGRSGLDDAIALVERRLIEATQNGMRSLSMKAAPRAASSLADLAALASGEIDLDRTLSLARALMAVDGRAWAMRPQLFKPPAKNERLWPDDAWLVIRLAMLPWPLPDGREIKADPAIIRRLASGDAATALELALRRLRAAGIRPAVRTGAALPQVARLWAAALAFPINRTTAEFMLRRLDPNSTQP
ncbi:MAG: type I-U CRISPR-associated protein Csx17 [Desulfobulbaceae bacterium A2]|nr:MAG: type I-U CRISPR-associated protein Csx17 [Desulfobulbaceae bacterium A2]